VTVGRVVLLTAAIGAVVVPAGLLVTGYVFYKKFERGPNLREVFGDAPPSFGTVEARGRVVRFAETGDPSHPLVLFVHGSPGAWHNFARYLADAELRARAHLVAPDRPGFGGSAAGGPEPSLAAQAAELEPILARNDSGRGAILVGHSYGGPLVARMALDAPERVASLILVAPSIDPSLERVHWYQRLAEVGLVRGILPGGIDASNQEVLPLAGELAELAPRWKSIHARVRVLQGERDRLVDRRNADFVERAFGGASLEVERIPDADHFIPWTHREHLRAAILEELDRLGD